MKIFITLFLLLFVSTSIGEIYRWTDSEGKVRFSDTPPEDQTSSEEISDKMTPINRDSSNEETEKLQKVLQGETPEEQAYREQQQAKQKTQEQATQRACEDAKQHLRLLQGRVYFEDEDGNEIIVTEEERQQRASKLESDIKRICP